MLWKEKMCHLSCSSERWASYKQMPWWILETKIQDFLFQLLRGSGGIPDKAIETVPEIQDGWQPARK